MGSNLTVDSLQKEARSVFTLNLIIERFDKESNIPYITSAHSTRPDTSDVRKTMEIVSQHRLITPVLSKSFLDPKPATEPVAQVGCEENKVLD